MADSNRALRALGNKPSLEQLKKQARDLLKQIRMSAVEALQRVRTSHPRHAGKRSIEAAKLSLSDAQLVIAREYGFESWPKLKHHVEAVLAASAMSDPAVTEAPPVPSTNEQTDDGFERAADAQLVVLFSEGYPHLRGRRYPLATACTTIGRAEAVDLALHSDAVSRRHARIERRDDGRFVLRDNDSTNGTFVAGQVEPVRTHLLADGDRFVLGDAILCFLQGPELEAKYQAALDRMSEQDALTHLLNGRAFRARLDRAVLHARGHGEALSLLIAGVDGLQQHNSALGHLAGNGLLLRVAELLRAELTDAAFIGRYGGDQFAAALPRITGGAAITAAERLRVALAHQPLTIAGEPVHVTISVGSATLADTTDTDELIDDALSALSQAKQSGRNAVREHAPLR